MAKTQQKDSVDTAVGIASVDGAIVIRDDTHRIVLRRAPDQHGYWVVTNEFRDEDAFGLPYWSPCKTYHGGTYPGTKRKMIGVLCETIAQLYKAVPE